MVPSLNRKPLSLLDIEWEPEGVLEWGLLLGFDQHLATYVPLMDKLLS